MPKRNQSANLNAKENARREANEGPSGQTLAPYTVPEGTESGSGKAKKQRAKPELDRVLDLARVDKAYWTERDRRMTRHQELFDLKELRPQEGQMLAYMNDPKVYVEKSAGLIARRKYQIQVPAKGEQNIDIAQRIENALRWWDKYSAREWSRGLYPPLPYCQVISLLLRGWVCERFMLASDDPTFVDEMLFDPLSIYPRMAGKRITRITHQYKTTIGELLNDFPDAPFDGDDPDKEVEVIGYYENEPPYWYCVVADKQWAKSPVRLEYWPWEIAVAKGDFSHFSGDLGDRAEYIGAGFLDAIEGIYKLINQFVTLLANTAAKQENPPKVTHTQDGKPVNVSVEAGGETNLKVNEKVEVLDVGGRVGQIMPLLSTFQDRINKGTYPSAMFGEGANLESGFMSALMIQAAQDSLWVFIAALQGFQGLRFDKFLTLFRDFADKGMEIVTSVKTKGENAGKAIWGDPLMPQDIIQNGTFVEVIYQDITPQDRVALANLAKILVEAKLLDLQTARETLLNVEDPGLINDRVLRDLAYLNEKFVQMLSELQWQKLGQDNEEVKLLMKAKREQEAAAQMAAMQQMQAQQVPQLGAPPVAPISPMNGLGPESLPPEMMGQGETEMDPALLLMQMGMQ